MWLNIVSHAWHWNCRLPVWLQRAMLSFMNDTEICRSPVWLREILRCLLDTWIIVHQSVSFNIWKLYGRARTDFSLESTEYGKEHNNTIIAQTNQLRKNNESLNSVVLSLICWCDWCDACLTYADSDSHFYTKQFQLIHLLWYFKLLFLTHSFVHCNALDLKTL